MKGIIVDRNLSCPGLSPHHLKESAAWIAPVFAPRGEGNEVAAYGPPENINTRQLGDILPH